MLNWSVSFLSFYWDFIEKETRGNKLFHNNYLAMSRCSASGKQCETMPGMFVYVWGKEALMQKLFMCRLQLARDQASHHEEEQPWRKEIRRRFRFFHVSSLDSMLTGRILVEKRIRLENVKHATSFNDLQTRAKTWSSGRAFWCNIGKFLFSFWEFSGGGSNMKEGEEVLETPLEAHSSRIK